MIGSRAFRSGSVATVVLVGALAFGMPAAEALVNPVPLGEFIMGAVTAAAPVEAGAGVVGPEGTLIASTVVALGALAYDTRDTWMPWVSGLFGAGGATSTPQPAAGGPGRQTFWDPPVVSGGSVTMTQRQIVILGDSYDSENFTYSCKDSSSSGVVTATVEAHTGDHWSDPWSQSWVGTCSPGWNISAVSTANDGDWPTGNQVTWGQPFDPHTQATYRVDQSCRKTDGTVETISATTTAPGNVPVPVDGVGGGGLLVPSCAGAFAGSHSEGLTVNGGQTGSPMHELSHQLFPTTSTLYPNCVGAGHACTYVVTYNGAPCVVGQAECVAWEHSRLAVGDAPYGCLFGAYAMTLAQCAVDERVYEPGGVTLTKLNTDGNPNTYDEPVPAWAPQPAPAAAPGAPGGAPAPVTGTQTPTTTTQTNNTDCWPSGGAAWNPADWVLTPVKCALSWAFVPRTATLATLAGTAQTDLATQGIGPMVTAVSANMSLVGSGTGCTGPAVTFAAVGLTKVMHPFDACTAPMSTLASISYALTTVVVVLGGGFLAIKAVAAGFGFNFSMRRGGGDEA